MKLFERFLSCTDYDLITNYGKDKFLIYMKSIQRNINHDQVFKQIYGLDFKDFLIDFKKEVMTKSDIAL